MSTDAATQNRSKPEVPMIPLSHVAALMGCPIMRIVPFYPHGSRTETPFCAIVRFNEAQGCLTLNVLRGGIFETRQGVRHMDDPYWQTHDAVKRQDGAWDYAPGQSPPPEIAKLREVEQMAPDIVRHWNNNQVDPAAIAKLTATDLAVVQFVLKRFVPGYLAK